MLPDKALPQREGGMNDEGLGASAGRRLGVFKIKRIHAQPTPRLTI